MREGGVDWMSLMGMIRAARGVGISGNLSTSVFLMFLFCFSAWILPISCFVLRVFSLLDDDCRKISVS